MTGAAFNKAMLDPPLVVSSWEQPSAAAIWSLADIAYIAIYRDMSKISRYNIAI